MTNFEIIDKLSEIQKYFTGTQYDHIVPLLEACVTAGRYLEAELLIKQFPTREVLLSALVEKLKKKSVYKTFKQIRENKAANDPQTLKALFSLGTHVAIEVEQGNKEYRALYPLIYEKIGKLLYRSAQ